MTRRRRPSRLAPGTGPGAARRPRRAGRRPRYWWDVFLGAAGGWKIHVSGMPRFPRAPSDWPLSVKNVAPLDPERTSIESFALSVMTLPFFAVTPAQLGS